VKKFHIVAQVCNGSVLNNIYAPFRYEAKLELCFFYELFR